MAFENILTTLEDGIYTVTINRPSKLNALNIPTIDELSEAIREAQGNLAVKVLIITGSGEKAFVAGADIAEFAGFSIEEGKALSANGQTKLFDLVENLSKPVIAAVNGFALGGGLELAMASHIRIVSETARMGLPEVSLGVIPGYGGTQRLAQLIGKGRAFEMVMTGGMIKADQALQWGLANHVTAPEELLDKSRALAGKIMKNSPVAVAHAIQAINAGYEDGVNGYDIEIRAFGSCFGTDDFKEGTAAFLEKRPANFPGK